MLNHLKTLVLLTLFFLSSSTIVLATPVIHITNKPVSIHDTTSGTDLILTTSTSTKSFAEALDWINSLNDPTNIQYQGYHWRLPFTPDGRDDCGWEYYDFTKKEYNKKNIISSEIGNIYHQILRETIAPESIFFNKSFWMGTSLKSNKSEYEMERKFWPGDCWVFNFRYGTQYLDSENFLNYALAIGTPIPEPSTGLLLLSGLLCLTARRKAPLH